MGPTLLVVHHSPTEATERLLTALLDGINQPELADVQLVVREALAATADDVLRADGYVLGTPTNFGYMSGALKHFFDTVYEDCLDASVGRPFGLYVHGRNDATGAVSSVERIVAGLRWKPAAETFVCLGAVDQDALDGCWNLGASIAARLLQGL